MDGGGAAAQGLSGGGAEKDPDNVPYAELGQGAGATTQQRLRCTQAVGRRLQTACCHCTGLGEQCAGDDDEAFLRAYALGGLVPGMWRVAVCVHGGACSAIAESNKLPLELALKPQPLVVVQALADVPQRLETPSHSGASFRTKLLRLTVPTSAPLPNVTPDPGQIQAEGEHVHRSATCLVIFAEDLERQAIVALKLMHNEGVVASNACGGWAPTPSRYRSSARRASARGTEADGGRGGVDPRLQGEDARFLLVMPCARRDLSDALAHYRFAGRDWKQVVEILIQVASHLRYLNEGCGRIHGDLKPRNLVQLETNSVDSEGVVTGTAMAWCLIDLDASCTLGDQAGQKITATRTSRRRWRGTSCRPPPGHPAAATVVASIGFEMWYFGCLMYQLCTGWRYTVADESGGQSHRRVGSAGLGARLDSAERTKLNKIVWPEADTWWSGCCKTTPVTARKPGPVLQHPFFGPDADAPPPHRHVLSGARHARPRRRRTVRPECHGEGRRAAAAWQGQGRI